jgi:cyclopropane fatty-acyl-phospholipid synthase-like methyltransferase
MEILLTALPEGAKVLELGCGSGNLTTRRLAERFVVTGVDISARQIELAQQHVPSARFIHADMTTLDLPTASFDAVASFYTISHVPREEHRTLLRAVDRWLRPGGMFVATMGAGPSEGEVEEDWLGAPMYFSHYDAETNRQLVQEAGMQIERASVEMTDEDGEQVPFLWIVARKP